MKSKKRGEILFKSFVILTVFGILIGFYSSRIDQRDLKENGIETIGIIVHFEHRAKRGIYVKYKFEIEGKSYFDNQKLTIKRSKIKLGDSFKVIFSKQNPNNSKMYFDQRISD